MPFSVLNNLPAMAAQSELQITQGQLQKTLFQLASGSRINSGADDAAGLAIANGLQANVTALTQSSANAASGVGLLQVADGALAQVTTLLNRAITLATEAATGTVSDAQRISLQAEFAQIEQEIDSIGSATTYNGTSVFTSNRINIFLSDAVTKSNIGVTTNTLSTATLGLTGGEEGNSTILTADDARATLNLLDAAIVTVANQRGIMGGVVNRLKSESTVEAVQVQNLTQAEDQIMAANIPQQAANLAEFSILSQSGISALAQANLAQQGVLQLLK